MVTSEHFCAMSTTLLRLRVETTRARRAKAVLADLGLKPADAINLFFAQVVSRQGLPFAVYRDETAELMDKPDFLRHLARMKSGAVKYTKLP
jgi:addiction module RelB/DinJ family antitoxin